MGCSLTCGRVGSKFKRLHQQPGKALTPARTPNRHAGGAQFTCACLKGETRDETNASNGAGGWRMAELEGAPQNANLQKMRRDFDDTSSLISLASLVVLGARTALRWLEVDQRLRPLLHKHGDRVIKAGRRRETWLGRGRRINSSNNAGDRGKVARLAAGRRGPVPAGEIRSLPGGA